jgi:hypothetical protein
MRLALIFLVLAAALSFASLQLQGGGLTSPTIVEARRSDAAPTELENTKAAPGDNATLETTVDLSAPPLFRPAQAQSGEQQAQPGERFALVGVAGQPGARIAFLRDEADGRSYSVRVGAYVGEWLVTDINERCATLRRSGRQREVCL